MKNKKLQDSLNFPPNSTDIISFEDKSDYIILHAFGNAPPYVQEYLQKNPNKWDPIKAFFFNNDKQRPALVIYKKQVV